MKKKIFKYIKVMMASLLIASLTLPSYAAVSASDGSAFVTKAEFDAAMSDFNARLTTFEAGINSKIDSQVSSYLDRNGIWNGKEQVPEAGFKCGVAFDGDYTGSKLAYPYKLFGYGVADATSADINFKGTVDAMKFPVAVATTVSDSSQGTAYSLQVPADMDFVYIKEVNKTGLLVMPYKARTSLFRNEANYQDKRAKFITGEELLSYNRGSWLFNFYKYNHDNQFYDLFSNEMIDGRAADAGLGWHYFGLSGNNQKSYYTATCTANFQIVVNDEIKFTHLLETVDMVSGNVPTIDKQHWLTSGHRDLQLIQTAMIFVQKGDKISFRGHWTGTGWGGLAEFCTTFPTNLFGFAIQPETIKIY